MGILSNIKDRIARAMENKREDRLQFEQMQKEARMQQQIMFQEEYKKRALEVAKIKAQQDAERLSGYAKIKAMNKVMNLENPRPANALSNLAEYTQRNLAKTQERLERTRVLRQVAMQERQKQMQSKNNGFRKPFGNTNRGII